MKVDTDDLRSPARVNQLEIGRYEVREQKDNLLVAEVYVWVSGDHREAIELWMFLQGRQGDTSWTYAKYRPGKDNTPAGLVFNFYLLDFKKYDEVLAAFVEKRTAYAKRQELHSWTRATCSNFF